jgi:hypothetical protein
MHGHIVLLGDSIFDNKSYVGQEPDVAEHLGKLLGEQWKVTLCAVDGNVARDLPRQLPRVPANATELVVSIGGNDGLSNIDMLSTPVRSTTEALALFAERVDRFEVDYRAAIAAVLALGKPTTVCTIYNGNLDPVEAAPARIGLMLFNDVIVRVAAEHSLGLLDLRAVCDAAEDYANPIEPSGSGGAKIAASIAHAVGALEGEGEVARIWSPPRWQRANRQR